jgi:hypothetical protein
MGTVISVALDRFYNALQIENAGHMSRYWNEASPEKAASAVRSRLWKPFIINNLQDLLKSLQQAGGFSYFW